MSYSFRVLATIVLATSFHASAFAAGSGSAQDLVIAELKGDVRLSVRGEPRAAQKGNAVDLPATIRTGRASSVELHQGQTTVAAGADTQLDIPATAVRGDLLERVVQSRGNTFYSVAKRGAKKFRVETPYLVAVVKGTQFNVAVQEDAATVSLFEGQLEIRSADGSDIVNIEAGEIAVRRASDTRIRVLRMDTGEPVARNNDAARGNAATTADGAIATNAGRTVGNVVAGGVENRVSVDVSTNTAGIDASATINGTAGRSSIDAGANIGVDLEGRASGVTVHAAAGADLGAGTVDASGSTSVDLGGASVTAGVTSGVDLGAGRVDVAANADATLGAVSANLGASASADLSGVSLDIGTDAGAAVGGVTAGASLDTGVDLGAGTVTTTVDVGAAGAGLTADTAIDLGAGTLDTGASLTAGGTTVGASVDVGGGTVGAGVTAGGIDLGLGVDLGNGGGISLDVGGTTSTGGSTTTGGSTVGSTVGNVVGGLLGGLGRRTRP